MSYVFAKKMGRGRGRKINEPLVSVTQRAISLNNALLKSYPDLIESYALLGVDYEKNKLKLIFTKENEDQAFKCQYHKKAKLISIRSAEFTKLLNQTESLALQRFRYRFKPKTIDMSERSIEIDLSNPYTKTKVLK